MAGFQVLSTLSAAKPLWHWLWSEAVAGKLGPAVASLLREPGAAAERALRRVGDAVVWDGPKGQEVLAHLESLGESQQRIQHAVTGLGAAQAALTTTLAAVHSLSLLTLGVTSLTGALMLWRLAALRKRHDELAGHFRDIEGHLNAMERAHLQSAVGHLDTYETQRPPDPDYLKEAHFESRRAAHIYRTLTADEANSRQRLEVLHYRGRLYVLALLTELRCCLLADNAGDAIKRAREEEETLALLARTTFQNTVGASAADYLRPEFGGAGVTLELLAEVYGQAQAAGAVDGPAVGGAGDLFERLRGQLAGGRYLPSLPRPFRRRAWRAEMLRRLRYAVACVEEVNRVRSLKLLVEDAQRADKSVREVSDQLAAWKATVAGAARDDEILAYRLA